ncbi:multidrug resistance protein [Diplodia corticola]|uniref:Multidrug resistance protein n=1 Tax=Diplodia corticola TaxID=236234 RepID=A0A1J9SBA1_9PEZI|nr:multidrug resistance protein [Diplodia corticola]OJD37767.1 multidrug resistance protein [Diplodia corticola]
MRDLIQESIFGQTARLLTRGKFLQYPEERDPSLWKRYIDPGRSGGQALQAASLSSRRAPNGESDEESKRSVDVEKEGIDSDTTSPDGRNQAGADADAENGKDTLLVTWYGPDDPANPQNWSVGKKFFVTFEICLLTFSIYIGSAIYTPGIQDVMQKFGVSQVAATLGLTLFVAGYGLGPMIWSPMSEIPYIGRNPVYFLTLIVFVVFQVPTALAVNFGMLLAFRFLTGFFGSPVLATGGASVGDMYAPRKRAYGMAVWGIAAVCGPTMGPLIGGFAAQAEGWTWTIWELMWLSGFCLAFIFFFLPETSSQNILYRRTRRLRKLTGNSKLKCEPEIMAENMTGKDIVLMALVRPITLNFTEPMVFLLNLYIALIYGLLYIWFESFVIVFVEIHGFDLGQQGLAYLGIFVGALVTIPPFFTYLYLVQEKQFNSRGDIKPEKRLPPAFVGAFCVPICLFWFGWSARADVHWIMPIIGSAFFSVAATLLFNSVLNYLADAYPDHVASVLAGNDVMRSAFGAGFPLFANAMYKDLGVGWASSTLAFLGIAFIPIPFVLYIYGERLRKDYSRHARKDF